MNMRDTKFPVFIIMVFLLGLLQAGCAQPGAITKDYKLQNDNPKGLIAVNASFGDIPYAQSLSFYFRNKEKNFESLVSALDMSMKEYWSDYYVEGERGSLAVIELDPGEYEFFTWTGSLGGWGGQRSMNSTQDFSRKFSVTAGKITYIGNIHLDVKGVSKLAIGQRLPAAVVVRDMRDKDVPAIFTNYPALNKDKLVVKIMN